MPHLAERDVAATLLRQFEALLAAMDAIGLQQDDFGQHHGADPGALHGADPIEFLWATSATDEDRWHYLCRLRGPP